MIEPQGRPGTYLALPVNSAARSIAFRSARIGGSSGYTFDPEITRGRRDPFAQTIGAEGDPVALRAFEPAPQFFSEASFVGGNAGAAPFLAQQIAQEMAAAEYVTPEQAASVAIGSYRAAPVASVTYDGPQIALDITV